MNITNMTTVNIYGGELIKDFDEDYLTFLYPEKDFSCLLEFTKNNTKECYIVVVTTSDDVVVALAPTYHSTYDEDGCLVSTTVEHHFEDSETINWDRVVLMHGGGVTVDKTKYEQSWKEWLESSSVLFPKPDWTVKTLEEVLNERNR